MTLHQYKKLESRDLIRTDNCYIKNITILGFGTGSSPLDVLIELGTSNGAKYEKCIRFPLMKSFDDGYQQDRVHELIGIFQQDDISLCNREWNFSEFVGKYIRICRYFVENEKFKCNQIVAIKHIVYDDKIFLIESDDHKRCRRQ